MSKLRKGNETKQQYQKRMDKEQSKRLGKGSWRAEEKMTEEEIQEAKKANIQKMKDMGVIPQDAPEE